MKTRRTRPREEALRLYLTGEATTNSAIASRLKVKSSQVAQWKRQQDWKACKGQMLEVARRRLKEHFAPESVMNANHLRVWGLLLAAMGETLASQSAKLTRQEIAELEQALAAAGRGIRLARPAA